MLHYQASNCCYTRPSKKNSWAEIYYSNLSEKKGPEIDLPQISYWQNQDQKPRLLPPNTVPHTW